MTTLPNLANLRLKSLMMRKKKDHELNLIEAYLKPIQALETESDGGSELSEIEDIFEDYHRNSYLKKQGRKYLTKYEADSKTMQQFTEAYKNTAKKVRKELEIGEEMLLETVEDIEKVFSKPVKHSKIEEGSSEVIDTVSIPSKSELNQMRKSCESSDDSMVWHLLQCNSDERKFKITPPGFDVFNQEERHWLEKPSVSWFEIDQARVKCEKWLDQCH